MRRLCLLLLLVSACTPPRAAEVPTRTFVYDCGGGYRFTARVDGGGARLFLPSGTRDLASLPTGNGERFADKELEFWSKGEEALLSIPGRNQRSCQNDRPRAIWEDARLRGVDFRAAGNEPGWFLEIDRTKIVYAGNYGREILTFPAAAPETNDIKAETRFVSAGAGHNLRVLLQAGDCRDSMSGEKFGTRVTLELDKKTFYGCGRALH